MPGVMRGEVCLTRSCRSRTPGLVKSQPLPRVIPRLEALSRWSSSPSPNLLSPAAKGRQNIWVLTNQGEPGEEGPGRSDLGEGCQPVQMRAKRQGEWAPPQPHNHLEEEEGSLVPIGATYKG